MTQKDRQAEARRQAVQEVLEARETAEAQPWVPWPGLDRDARRVLALARVLGVRARVAPSRKPWATTPWPFASAADPPGTPHAYVRHGEPGTPGIVYFPREPIPDLDYPDAVWMLHEVMHALLGEDEATTMPLESQLVKALEFTPKAQAEMIRYQPSDPGVVVLEYRLTPWMRQSAHRKPRWLLNSTMNRHVRSVLQEVP